MQSLQLLTLPLHFGLNLPQDFDQVGGWMSQSGLIFVDPALNLLEDFDQVGG
jgi:hypothetical protein